MYHFSNELESEVSQERRSRHMSLGTGVSTTTADLSASLIRDITHEEPQIAAKAKTSLNQTSFCRLRFGRQDVAARLSPMRPAADGICMKHNQMRGVVNGSDSIVRVRRLGRTGDRQAGWTFVRFGFGKSSSMATEWQRRHPAGRACDVRLLLMLRSLSLESKQA